MVSLPFSVLLWSSTPVRQTMVLERRTRGRQKGGKSTPNPPHTSSPTLHIPTPPWLALSHLCISHVTPEINLLIYRYLAESGFTHSAFTFAHESLVARSVVSDAEVPPGALISFLQKGLQYVEIETHLQEDGSERVCDEPFTMLAPHVCRLRSAVGKAGSGGAGGAKGGGAALGFSTVEAPPSDVTVLTGHTGEVFTLAWNPKTGSLATGSGDGCARLWRVLGVEGSGGGSNSSSSASSSSSGGGEVCTVLRHTAGEHGRLRKDEPHDVSSMDWSPDGTKLVTGSVDGRGRIWSGGALLHTLSLHAGQIYASQWNPSGSLIATASVDKTTAVWDATTGEPRHSYAFHSAPVLDVDWCSDSMFASGGTDKVIHLCAVGSTAPSRTFLGHTDEVNTLRWSPSKALLASGSDDSTVRLWSAGGEGAPPVGAVATLTGHKKQVYCVRWAPTGEGSANPNKAPILASSSFDGTLRLWDASSSKSRLSLTQHTALVYSLAFSPDGDYLVSSSADRQVCVWSTKDGALVRTFTGPSASYEAAFSPDGNKVACCFSSGAVAVIDLKF